MYSSAYQRGGGVRTEVPIKGEKRLFVLMCLSKGRRGENNPKLLVRGEHHFLLFQQHMWLTAAYGFKMAQPCHLK